MPSRLVRNCPGCAISAGTARSTMPPTPSGQRHRGGARAAVRGVDARIVQHFERQAGGLRGFLRQHDRARAGVEHHRDARAVDLGRDLEFAALAARDLDRAAARRRAAGHEFGQHAVADVAQIEAVGVADRQHQPDHDPEHRGLKRLREALAKQRQHRAADEDQQARS